MSNKGSRDKAWNVKDEFKDTVRNLAKEGPTCFSVAATSPIGTAQRTNSWRSNVKSVADQDSMPLSGAFLIIRRLMKPWQRYNKPTRSCLKHRGINNTQSMLASDPQQIIPRSTTGRKMACTSLLLCHYRELLNVFDNNKQHAK